MPPRPCARCPHWGDGWCPIRGVRRTGTAPSCEYGRRAMNSRRAAEWARKNRKGKK